MALLLVLAGGTIRYHSNSKVANTIKVGGVTVSAIPFLETLYKDASGKTIHIDPPVSPVDPVLQEANVAMLPFIEQPDTVRFRNTLRVLKNLKDSLFESSGKAANKGATIIVWSEGSLITWKQNEGAVITRAQSFAKQHEVSMLIAIAAFKTGKITAGKKFIENKAVYIDRTRRRIEYAVLKINRYRH